MTSVYEILKERGFIYQCTDEDKLKTLLNSKKVTFYIGYDATANSLHIGNLLTIMAVKHMQSAGHKVITLVGGATTIIGDPTDRTELRKMLTREEINSNVESIKKDLQKFIDFEGSNKAKMVNNLDWLA